LPVFLDCKYYIAYQQNKLFEILENNPKIVITLGRKIENIFFFVFLKRVLQHPSYFIISKNVALSRRVKFSLFPLKSPLRQRQKNSPKKNEKRKKCSNPLI
jgi:hypothetical protein